MEYLTESKLVEFCKNNFIECEFRFNKKLIEAIGYNYRPDIYIINKKIIIEFDGYQHYTKAKNVYNDFIRDKIIKAEFGITTIRIPYFVQLSKVMCNHYFEKLLPDNFEIEQIYSHGFIDEFAVFPADFCMIGVTRFINEIHAMPKDIRKPILRSLDNKVKYSNMTELVVFPPHEAFWETIS